MAKNNLEKIHTFTYYYYFQHIPCTRVLRIRDLDTAWNSVLSQSKVFVLRCRIIKIYWINVHWMKTVVQSANPENEKTKMKSVGNILRSIVSFICADLCATAGFKNRPFIWKNKNEPEKIPPRRARQNTHFSVLMNWFSRKRKFLRRKLFLGECYTQ